MNGRSRSALFLIEQLIVITIFAVCASVCVKVFVGSYLMTRDAQDVKRALIAAKNGAESFKAYGDLEKTAALLNGRRYEADGLSAAAVYFDGEWMICGEAEAVYALRLENRSAGDNGALPLVCDLSVEKITGEKIVGFTVASRRKNE